MSLLKGHRVFFKLCCEYSNSLKMSHVGDLSLSVYLLNKTSHTGISLCSRAGKAKKCTKSLLHVQSCCFADQTYCSFDVSSPSSLLKLPFVLACPRRSETGEGEKQSEKLPISRQSPPSERLEQANVVLAPILRSGSSPGLSP